MFAYITNYKMKKLILIPLFALFLTACGGGDNEKVAVVTEQPRPELVCEENTTGYALENTPLEFCYTNSWGAPVMEVKTAATGELTWIHFADNENAPQFFVESTDYVPAEGVSKIIDFTGLRVTATPDSLEEQIREALGAEGGEIKVRKGDAGRVRALRADLKYGNVDNISYFVKDAFEGYNMTIRAGRDMAADLDDFVFDIVL